VVSACSHSAALSICGAPPRAHCQYQCRSYPRAIFSWHADDGRVSRCDRNTHCHHRQSAHAHQAPCAGPGRLAPCSLHAAAAGGLQPTSVSAPSSRAAARMSGGTDLGHRRRPGPRLARAAPVTPILLGFGRGTPGFHPEGCAGFNSRSSELKPAQPWELKPAAVIRTSTGTDADVGGLRPHIAGDAPSKSRRESWGSSAEDRAEPTDPVSPTV
jgi:hypothetical protein